MCLACIICIGLLVTPAIALAIGIIFLIRNYMETKDDTYKCGECSKFVPDVEHNGTRVNLCLLVSTRYAFSPLGTDAFGTVNKSSPACLFHTYRNYSPEVPSLTAAPDFRYTISNLVEVTKHNECEIHLPRMLCYIFGNHRRH